MGRRRINCGKELRKRMRDTRRMIKGKRKENEEKCRRGKEGWLDKIERKE
jgi:hypothetical protein